MTTTERTHVATGTASRRGTRPLLCDAAAVHQLHDTGIVAAAIVDGIGNTPAVARMVDVAAEVIARIAPRQTAQIGILAAAQMIASPEEDDAVAAVAVVEPGDPTRIAWTGDCRVYGWTGTALVQRTTDQTMGQWLRVYGGPAADLAAGHDNWVLATLGRCSIATVRMAEIEDAVMVLTSDGVHDQVPHGVMETLVREHADDPQGLADALVAAAQPDEEGYRDDATAVVLLAHPVLNPA